MAAVVTALVALSMFSPPPSVYAPPNPIIWITRSSIPYATGQAAVVGGLDGRIYVMGGFSSSGGSPLTTARVYDPRTDTWANMTSLPTPTRGPGGAVDQKGLIYVISGYSGIADISNVQIYNATTNTWSAGTAIPTPVWESGATTGSDGRIYVAGGEVSGSGTTILQIYSPTTHLWTSGTSMSTARREFQLVSAPNGLLYAIGGYGSTGALSSVEAYNITSNTWTAKAVLPTAVDSYGAAVGPDGLIYVFGGGTSYTNNGSPYFNSVYSYDPASNTWYTNTQNLPTARREVGAATSLYNNRMYVMGGANGGSSYLTTNEEATIGTGHNTITTVSCSPASINIGQSTTCNATVTDTSSVNATAPTGTVAFASTGTGTFSGSPCTLVPGTGANATCALSVTYTPTVVGTGSHVIRGTYSGDSTHNPSVSTGNQAFTVTVIGRTTSTVVSCSPSSVVVNNGSTCTATVTDTASGTPSTPNGTVSFTRSGTAAGSFNTASCTLSSGSCSVVFTPSSAGTATITGSYGGDAVHFASSGASSAITSTLRTVTIAFSCHPTTIVVYNSTSCTATVTDTSPAPTLTPTGTVILSSSGTGTFTSCNLSGSGGAATCTTTYTPNSIGTGSHLLSAHYGGDSGHSAASPDATATITVTLRSAATSVFCTSPAAIGTATSCTITVTDNSPGTYFTPTGTVTLTTSGTGSFSGTCTLSGSTSFATCSATYTPGGNTARTDTITANYPGDTTHGASNGSFLLTVNLPSPPPVATITSITPNPAQQGNTITFVGTGSGGTIIGYNWRSSISGNLSTGASFQVSGLPAGTHTIYFRVENSNGTWSQEVSTTLTITSDTPSGSGVQPAGFTTMVWLGLAAVLAAVGAILYVFIASKRRKTDGSPGPRATVRPSAPPPSPPPAPAPTAVAPQAPTAAQALPPAAVSQSSTPQPAVAQPSPPAVAPAPTPVATPPSPPPSQAQPPASQPTPPAAQDPASPK